MNIGREVRRLRVEPLESPVPDEAAGPDDTDVVEAEAHAVEAEPART